MGRTLVGAWVGAAWFRRRADIVVTHTTRPAMRSRYAAES
jgi:hypothetical protein